MATPLRRDARGFTLTEIMVTLVIFGIVMAVSFPMLSESNRNHQLAGAAARVEAALMRARSVAVTQQTPVRVSFNADTNTLQIDQDSNNDGNFDILMRTVNIDGNINFADISFNNGNVVTFDQRGAPDNPGTILLANGGDSNQRILVSAGSGAVTVSAVAAAYGEEGTETPGY